MSIKDRYLIDLKECRDFNRPKKEGIPLPTLFHASTDVNNVCLEGLLPRCDLNGKCGLGGGTDKLVSFTTDSSIAVEIAKDLQNVINIANGTLGFNNYCEKLNKHDGSDKMTKSPCDIMSEGIYHYLGIENFDPQEILNWFKKGYIFDYSNFPRTKAQWLDYPAGIGMGNKGLYIKDHDDIQFLDKNPDPYNKDEDEYSAVVYKANPNELIEKFYRIFNFDYLRKRQSAGGRPNPTFWGIKLEKLRHLKDKDVGIIEAEGNAPDKIADSRGNIHKVDNFKELLMMKESKGFDRLFDSLNEDAYGFNIMGALDEIRLSRDRFNKVKIRKDLMK